MNSNTSFTAGYVTLFPDVVIAVKLYLEKLATILDALLLKIPAAT